MFPDVGYQSPAILIVILVAIGYLLLSWYVFYLGRRDD